MYPFKKLNKCSTCINSQDWKYTSLNVNKWEVWFAWVFKNKKFTQVSKPQL